MHPLVPLGQMAMHHSGPGKDVFLQKALTGALKGSTAGKVLGAGTLLSLGIKFDKAINRSKLQQEVNGMAEEGRHPMVSFSKNSELRKMAMVEATTKINEKIAGGLNSLLQYGAGEGMKGSLGQSLIGGVAGGVGKGLAEAGLNAVGGGLKSLYNAFSQPSASNVLKVLMESDPIISKADPVHVVEAYASMRRFAPTLATDINAVRSYLREALTVGAGPDFATISNLAKAEQLVNGKGKGGK